MRAAVEELKKGPPILSEAIEKLEAQIARYEELGSDSHQILLFSPEKGGRIAEVHGNLDTADTIAVVVPGVGNDLDNFPTSDSNGARLAQHTDSDTAVIEWWGYDTPSGFESPDPGALHTHMAETGGRDLFDFVQGLEAVSDAEIAISAHSYGTVVATEAAKLGLEVDTVVLLGSPGVPADSAAVFNGADVYVARNQWEFISEGGRAVHDLLLGGTDPASDGFGATKLNANEGFDPFDPFGAHSTYYEPGSDSLWSISDAINHVEARYVNEEGLDVVVRTDGDGNKTITATARF